MRISLLHRRYAVCLQVLQQHADACEADFHLQPAPTFAELISYSVTLYGE